VRMLRPPPEVEPANRPTNGVAATPAPAGNGLASHLAPLLVDAAGAGTLLDMSARSVRRMDSAALMPRAITCGHSKKWRTEEIRSWVLAGCPNRSDWEDMQK
jgi:hypothetical protein